MEAIREFFLEKIITKIGLLIFSLAASYLVTKYKYPKVSVIKEFDTIIFLNLFAVIYLFLVMITANDPYFSRILFLTASVFLVYNTLYNEKFRFLKVEELEKINELKNIHALSIMILAMSIYLLFTEQDLIIKIFIELLAFGIIYYMCKGIYGTELLIPLITGFVSGFVFGYFFVITRLINFGNKILGIAKKSIKE